MKLIRLRQCIHDAETNERLLTWAGIFDERAVAIMDAIVRAHNSPRESGSIGGSSRSRAKKAAAKRNGKKGGRPRKKEPTA